MNFKILSFSLLWTKYKAEVASQYLALMHMAFKNLPMLRSFSIALSKKSFDSTEKSAKWGVND